MKDGIGVKLTRRRRQCRLLLQLICVNYAQVLATLILLKLIRLLLLVDLQHLLICTFDYERVALDEAWLRGTELLRLLKT